MNIIGLIVIIIAAIIVLLILLPSSIRILREYEIGVIFRLGRYIGNRGPGFVMIIPGAEKMVRVDKRTRTIDVPPQDVITRDNVPVKVNAVLYFRIVDPAKSVLEVENFRYAALQISQTTLRSILGQAELDELLSKREKINSELAQVIDELTDPWGVKVTVVEIKDVEIPQSMQRALAAQAEAERDRRAKVINAEGELQASQKLLEAAQVMSRSPVSIQLRYLQTLREIATEQNSTILFPIPMDLINTVVDKLTKK
ncbi:MAG: slipin family protein [Actinobacteria bacterium]|nr:slipin family protein [Cyanobacteriota bacterium]MCL6087322.1 slipin family protein [Actinomycetota bacterium]